jgi:hypothetical protein
MAQFPSFELIMDVKSQNANYRFHNLVLKVLVLKRKACCVLSIRL